MIPKSQDLFRHSFDSLYEATAKKGMTKTASATVRPTLESAVYANDHLILDHAAAQGFALAPVEADEYAIQKPIREWFGKTGVNEGTIGSHPDFQNLRGTDNTEFHHITTIFIDIKNSTRLSLRYDLETVRNIKNTILRAASETVRALDGHVHRFMGDALMGYFGGKNRDRESACMAALNCAAILRLLMVQSIVPALKARSIEPDDMGFRVGIDFGKDEDVLWSSYGYSDVSEVTATSYYVDAAAKLQSMAAKDSTMIGDSLLQFLDFPDVFTEPKTELRNGEQVPVPYLLPNYSRPEGGTRDYRIRQLKFDSFTKLLPIPLAMREQIFTGLMARPGISFSAFTRVGEKDTPYPSMSRCIDKGTEVVFQVQIEAHVLNGLRMPLYGKFIRKNYGNEAAAANQSDDDVKEFELRPTRQSNPPRNNDIVHTWKRDASYRGLHTMEVRIYNFGRQLIFSDIVGVHIR